MTEQAKEKTLHELNLEQRRYAQERRRLHIEAGDAAKDAVVTVLTGYTPTGKRIQKSLRAPVE